MKEFRNIISDIEGRLKLLKEDLKIAEKDTAKFLEECKNSGIKKVSIGKMTKDWPFNPQGSVFTLNDERENGWPAIWRVVERCGISGGCGNTNQHQVRGESLMEGIYELKGGKWKRVD